MCTKRVVTDVLECVGIDYATFVGREKIRANLAFPQALREQHEDRGESSEEARFKTQAV